MSFVSGWYARASNHSGVGGRESTYFCFRMVLQWPCALLAPSAPLPRVHHRSPSLRRFGQFWIATVLIFIQASQSTSLCFQLSKLLNLRLPRDKTPTNSPVPEKYDDCAFGNTYTSQNTPQREKLSTPERNSSSTIYICRTRKGTWLSIETLPLVIFERVTLHDEVSQP